MNIIRKIMCGGQRRGTKQPTQPPHMFGSSLDEIFEREGNAVPFVVQKLCGYLTTDGRMKTKGLFRVNGNIKVIRKIKQSFDEVGSADLHRINNVHACASLLKLFLRSTADPVIPAEHQERLFGLQERYCPMGENDEETLVEKISEELRSIPARRFKILRYLVEFILNISAHSDVNGMTEINLGMVFGPSLFRCGHGPTGARDQVYANGLLMVMLRRHDTLFPENNNSIITTYNNNTNTNTNNNNYNNNITNSNGSSSNIVVNNNNNNNDESSNIVVNNNSNDESSNIVVNNNNNDESSNIVVNNNSNDIVVNNNNNRIAVMRKHDQKRSWTVIHNQPAPTTSDELEQCDIAIAMAMAIQEANLIELMDNDSYQQFIPPSEHKEEEVLRRVPSEAVESLLTRVPSETNKLTIKRSMSF